MERDEIERRCQKFADEMGEFVDSVRVFVTHPSLDGNSNTVGFTSGIGNIYAQIGQVDDWVRTQKEYVLIRARKDIEDED